jgi:hypothetical protein
MSDHYAVITLTNTTSITLDLSVSIGGQQYFVVSLAPQQSTTQLSPTGASWTLGQGQGSGLPLSGLADEGGEKPTDMTG